MEFQACIYKYVLETILGIVGSAPRFKPDPPHLYDWHRVHVAWASPDVVA